MKNKFRGTGVALVTPFDDNNQVDFDALDKLVAYVTDNGVDYLVVFGTTAETATLNSDEKIQIKKRILDKNAGKLPIVLGIGGNNTAEVVEAIKTTDLSGVDAILTVTPYYNKPNQRGLYEHYKAVA